MGSIVLRLVMVLLAMGLSRKLSVHVLIDVPVRCEVCAYDQIISSAVLFTAEAFPLKCDCKIYHIVTCTSYMRSIGNASVACAFLVRLSGVILSLTLERYLYEQLINKDM